MVQRRKAAWLSELPFAKDALATVAATVVGTLGRTTVGRSERTSAALSEREGLFEGPCALGPDPRHVEPFRRSGGDDARNAPEPSEQSSRARSRNSGDSGEQRLGRLLTRLRTRALSIGGPVGGGLDLLASDGEAVDP